MHPRTIFLLRNIGLSPREIQAVSLPQIHELPDQRTGHGLIGGTGVGKTFAMAQILANAVEKKVMGNPTPDDATLPHGYARWINWPDKAEELKNWVSQGYHKDIADTTEDWSNASVIFLDDIGQERITGENDYSLGVLRILLDSRYRNQMPVYWTSNLNLKGLTSIYGARLVSRVVQAWPPIVLRGSDLRLAEAACQ